MCPVSAHTSGAAWVSSAPSRNTVARDREQLGDVERRPVAAGSAAAAAAGLVSQPSAGMIVEVIEVRVRSLVFTNCRASCSNAGSAARRSSTGTSRCGPLRVGDPAEHVAHPLVPERGGVQQRGEDPAGLGLPELPIPRPGLRPVAAIMSVARSVATTGSAHPVSGSNVIVDGRSGEADGVEHEHRTPPPAQRGAQLVEVGAGAR